MARHSLNRSFSFFMKFTIWTFPSTPFHLVLARFSILPVIALPPFMVFPLIPILAYALIASIVSYISVRIFKRFKISSDIFGFLRRKGRFSPFSISSNEHELLPTSTPSRLPNAAIGVYAGSSNVSILRSSSVNLLPGSPPLLISPASSPPPNTPFRRTINRSLASFSLLEPTCRKPRRSRSLSVLISRSQDRSSRVSPVLPPQRGILDDDTMNKDWISLAPMSRNLTSARGTWSSRDTLAPAPVLNASISAPVTPRPNPDLLGPLIDISPISPSPSDPHDPPLALMSSSSSELAPPSYSSPSEPNSNSPSGLVMSLSRSSDIGIQRIGGAAGFAYDWGFETRSRTAPHASEKQDVNGPLDVPPIFSASFDATGDAHHTSHEIPHLEGQIFDGGEQEKSQQVEMVFIEKLEEHDAEPIPENTDPLSKPSEMEVSADIKIALEEETIDSATFEGDFVTEIVVCDSNTENTLTKACQDPWIGVNEANLFPLPFTGKAIMGERPPVSIDTTQPPKLHKEDALLSAKKGFCPSPLQTPTPPASPPMMPMTIARFTGFSQLEPMVPTEPEPVLSAEMGEVDSEGMAQEGDTLNLPVNQDAGLNSIMAHATADVGVEQSEDAPVISASSETSSPSSDRPAWSARAVDAPPLGFSVTRAAMVEEEVAWPKAPKKKEAVAELESKESTRENVSEEPAAQQAVVPEDLSTEPVQGAGDMVQAPVLKSTPSLPGSFPQELEPVQKDIQVVSAMSTAVAHTVVGSGTGRRRRNLMRGLPIDVALAMQLRPGFGVGADPAWMVRFLMSVFGWFAIMIAGRGGDVDVYAL